MLIAPVKLGPLRGVKSLKPVRTMKTSPRVDPVTDRRARYDSQQNRSVGKSFDQAIKGTEFNSTGASPRAPSNLPALGPFKSKLQPVRGSNSTMLIKERSIKTSPRGLSTSPRVVGGT